MLITTKSGPALSSTLRDELSGSDSNESGSEGFTLIEALIYIAILAIVLFATVFGAYNIIESTGRGDTDVFVEEEANFILRKVSWVLTGAFNVNSPAAGAANSTLSVVKAGYSQNPVVVELSGTNVTLAEGGGAAVVLNSEFAPIEDLVFEHKITGSPSVHTIMATITIDGRTFSLSRVIR